MTVPRRAPEGVGAFLRQLLDDVSQGRLRSLEDYQARFPDADSDVAALYVELHASAARAQERNEPAKPGDAGAKGGDTAPRPRAKEKEGERLLGDFRLLRELGRGGMGVVYEAEQISLGRTVAVKVLSNSLAMDERARARFAREAQLAAQLDHSGIAKVLAAEEVDDVLFFAMELVEGVALDRVLAGIQSTPCHKMTGLHLQQSVAKANTALRLRRPGRGVTTAAGGSDASRWRPSHIECTVDIGIQVADALHHAHQQGVVHRDIKPGNIMLRTNGSAVLTDFGLARGDKVSALTATGDFLGTPFYVSPEQITAGQVPVDHRTDVYSLGVTLYELLAHRRPFEAEVATELKARILTKEPPRLRRFNPMVPQDLDCIVLKALEKDPDRRYQTAMAFADDLRAFLAGRPVTARPVSVWTRSARWSRRNPLAAGFVAVLVVGLAILAGLLMVTLRALEERERFAVPGRARALLQRDQEVFPA